MRVLAAFERCLEKCIENSDMDPLVSLGRDNAERLDTLEGKLRQCVEQRDALEAENERLRSERDEERKLRQLGWSLGHCPACGAEMGGEMAEKTIERLRAELATARNDALERAARMCEKSQTNKNRQYDGEWKTLGTTEIDGSTFAYDIRAMKAKP